MSTSLFSPYGTTTLLSIPMTVTENGALQSNFYLGTPLQSVNEDILFLYDLTSSISTVSATSCVSCT